MLNLYFIWQALKHYASATPIDVLHSPFVFDLYNKSIKRQPPVPVFYAIEAQRNALLKNNTVINYTDFGALKISRKLTIKKIAATHLKPARIAQVLFYLTKFLKPAEILELGTSLGITTAYLVSANQANVTTIEGCKDLQQFAIKNLTDLNLNKQVNFVLGNFNDVLPSVLNKYKTIDLAFIDGNHTYQATLDYFNKLLPYMHNNSCIIFDDIYWSKGMTRAWQEICHHPQITASIDLFFIGLVFFRKEQRQQNFKLRIW